MKKYILSIPVLILTAVILVVIVSFFTPQDKTVEETEGDISLYYISAQGYTFKQVPYKFLDKSSTVNIVKEVMEQLKTVPSGMDCLPSIPSEIIWSDITMDHSNVVIDFTAEYTKIDSTKEIMLRASVVKTLVQIEGIRTVEFKITGTPLMALSNQPVGLMDSDDFIDGSEKNWGVNMEEKVQLYFADESGTRLVEKEVDITVVNNVSMEQLVIEALINTDKFHSPIPKGTQVLKTVTRDQICYVDLSKEFLIPMEDVTGEVTIFAIVNSLVQRTGVNKVQFTVEGKQIENYQSGKMDLSQPISRNLDLIDK